MFFQYFGSSSILGWYILQSLSESFCKNYAQIGVRGSLKIAVRWEFFFFLCVECFTLTLRWTAIKGCVFAFVCFSYVHIMVWCHESWLYTPYPLFYIKGCLWNLFRCGNAGNFTQVFSQVVPEWAKQIT